MASKTGFAKDASRRARQTNPAVLRQAMLRRVPKRVTGRGQIELPAVPALVDHHVHCLETIFGALGRVFTPQELGHLRGIMERSAQEAFQVSPTSKIVVRWETEPLPAKAISYNVSIRTWTTSDEYADWVKIRKPPLFGEHPDAKVMELARSLGPPAEVPVLDIGAGTGRNAVPLAREGFPVDAVEVAPALIAILREAVAAEGLAVRVLEGDALDPSLDVPIGHYRLVVLAEVVASHFRRLAQLRTLFERSAGLLAPGGLLVLSAFLASEGYKPDPLARQMSEMFWCCLFTRREMLEAIDGLPFDRISDESASEFERAHLPSGQWPPTGWYEAWANGRDLFDLPQQQSPCELRWLVYRRR